MNNLMSDYQRVIAMSRYARWNGEKQRRETWQETVTRLLNFYKDYLNKIFSYRQDIALDNYLIRQGVPTIWSLENN